MNASALVLLAITSSLSLVAPIPQQVRQGKVASPPAACDSAEAWAAAHESAVRLFGATSKEWGYEPGKATWREYSSGAQLAEAAAGGNLFYEARVWILPEGWLLVRTAQSSFSGDWALGADNCFRASGTIARIRSELRMLPNGMITRQQIDFDGAGRESARSTLYYDLESERELDAAEGQRREWAKIAVTVYKRSKDLPFRELFERRSGAK